MRTKTLFLLVICCANVAFAQIKIADNWNVGIGLSSSTTPLSRLSVGGAGDADADVFITGHNIYALKINGGMYGIHASTPTNFFGNSIALQGTGSQDPSIRGIAIGARGIANNKGYGVSGLIDGTIGAGVYGGTGSEEATITGLYAGYFDGNVVVNGTINGIDISNSDIRYKQDILGLDPEKSLKGILMMRPVEYRLKQQYTEYKEDDVIKQHPVYDEKSEMFQKKHYGLIAQELQELCPDLIYETNAEGYLGINYTEIIPMLIQSIQELHKQTEIIPVLMQSIQELNKEIETLKNPENKLKSDTDTAEKEIDTKKMTLTK